MEGPDVTPNITETTVAQSTKSIIYRHLETEENVFALLDTLKVFINQMGLAPGQNTATMAQELLAEVVTEALEHSDRYDPDQSKPGTWLNGIARNIVRHKRDKNVTRTRLVKELSFSELQRDQEELSEEELIERVSGTFTEGPEPGVESDEQFEIRISSLSEDDKYLLRLYIYDDFNAPLLAEKLGITQEAARQRISRIVRELRRESRGGEQV